MPDGFSNSVLKANKFKFLAKVKIRQEIWEGRQFKKELSAGMFHNLYF